MQLTKQSWQVKINSATDLDAIKVISRLFNPSNWLEAQLEAKTVASVKFPKSGLVVDKRYTEGLNYYLKFITLFTTIFQNQVYFNHQKF